MACSTQMEEVGKNGGRRKEEERGASLYTGQGCHPHWLVPLSSSGVGVGKGGLLSDKGANNNDALVKQQGTKRLPQSEVISVCRGVLKGANSTGTLLIYKGASTIGTLLDSQSSSLFLIDGWRPTTT
jgi:hypothetical protein